MGGWGSWEEDRGQRGAGDVGGAAGVAWASYRYCPEIAAAYASDDAAIFPVRWEEPWGLVPLEAMGKGRPVAATGRGGSAEYLVDSENCVLFEADDARGLADALRRLASDAGLRARLREGGLETASRY